MIRLWVKMRLRLVGGRERASAGRRDGYCWKWWAGRSAGSGGGGGFTRARAGGCCASVCRRKYSGVLKLRPHVAHATGCASWISRTCWRRFDALLYRRPHSAHCTPPPAPAPTPAPGPAPAPTPTPAPTAANNTTFALRRHTTRPPSPIAPRSCSNANRIDRQLVP